MQDSHVDSLLSNWMTVLSVHSTAQEHPVCRNFEVLFQKCVSKYGRRLGRKECWREADDLIECSTQRKQQMRVAIMKAERRKQGRPYLPDPKQITVDLRT